MKILDHIISFPLAVLLHIVGLLLVCSQVARMASADPTTTPEVEVLSVELSPAESESDSSPDSAHSEPRTPNPEPLALPVPDPFEPPALPVSDPVELPPPEDLPDKPDFTSELTPTPLPEPQPQPSPIVLPQPAPPAVPRPPASVPRPPSSAPRLPAPSPAPAGPPATLQSVGSGEGANGRVDGHPSLERAIKPNYPIGARRRGEEGTVILDVTVDESGRAAKVSLVSSCGYPDLDRAAEHAATAARFKPGTRDNKPVESAARLTLIFRLRDS